MKGIEETRGFMANLETRIHSIFFYRIGIYLASDVEHPLYSLNHYPCCSMSLHPMKPYYITGGISGDIALWTVGIDSTSVFSISTCFL